MGNSLEPQRSRQIPKKLGMFQVLAGIILFKNAKNTFCFGERLVELATLESKLELNVMVRRNNWKIYRQERQRNTLSLVFFSWWTSASVTFILDPKAETRSHTKVRMPAGLRPQIPVDFLETYLFPSLSKMAKHQENAQAYQRLGLHR